MRNRGAVKSHMLVECASSVYLWDAKCIRNEIVLQQTPPGVGDGQGGLACCDSWSRKESDTTEWLKWTELNTSINWIPWKNPQKWKGWVMWFQRTNKKLKHYDSEFREGKRSNIQSEDLKGRRRVAGAWELLIPVYHCYCMCVWHKVFQWTFWVAHTTAAIKFIYPWSTVVISLKSYHVVQAQLTGLQGEDNLVLSDSNSEEKNIENINL